jgi:hypothetical protein
MNEETGQLPKAWCKTVASILKEAKPGTVFIRQRARRDWASLTSCPFDSALREVLADALGTEGLKGKKHYMDEPGETHSFIFRYGDSPLYTKINLTSQNQIVIVYFAHRPLKGEDL